MIRIQISTKRTAVALLAAACASIGPAQVAAQTFPSKPIRLVVPFAPGGGTDLIARVLGEQMTRDLGQPVLVENKPGAGTIIGTELVAKSAPDGYTLVVSTFAHAVNPSLHAKLPYSNATSFAPVTLIGRSPNVLVARADRGLRTVAEVLAHAKANPGKLNYGSFGNGTSAHLAAELFKSLAKVDITHIAYKGSAPAITDLLGGQIDLMFTTVASVAKHVDSGKLIAIAVTSAQRSPAMPDVPTIAEAGVPGYVAESWYGVYAPAGTPREVIARLNASLKLAASSESFKSKVESEGLVVSASSPEELASYVAAEQARWQKIVRAAGITAN